MSAAGKEGVIPDPAGGDELAEDARPVESDARRRGKERWARLSDAEKQAEKDKAAAGRQRAKEAKEGKRGGDSAPKRKATRTPPVDTKAADLAAIRELLGGVLSAPSMVGAMRGDAWLTSHFMTRGPQLADAIVAEAARNDAFRAYLVRIAKAAQGASLIGAVAMYVLPPLMHFGIAPGAELLGVPVVEPPLAPGARAAAPPVPGRTPQFVAPERGPAERMPDPPSVRVDGVAAFREEFGDGPYTDELAAELRGSEDTGGMAPPLPMEPV
ncbi:MAG TPA: hypothetical protein VHU24_03215 [Solirubrobacterales bacterium]|jgi:hypothetical protein|nr:hypothetical protein [Solirubrobacterales bacterium]